MFGFWFLYFGKETICILFMLFLKCICIGDKIYSDFFGSIPNAIFIAYAIAKRPHDELSICCMTFAYLYNKHSTFVNFFNNCIISLGSVLVNGFLKSYIAQCELGMEMCSLIKIW